MRVCPLSSRVNPKAALGDFERSGVISAEVLLGNPRAEVTRNLWALLVPKMLEQVQAYY